MDKFNYLKSLLSGTALEAVAGLTLSEANYQEAVTILNGRFGNRQRIIDKHMDQLLNVSSVTTATNLSGLRRLFDAVENHVRSLKSLGVASESYGSLLSSVLLNKLPEEVRLLISRKVPEDDWSLDSLMKELQDELQARERVALDKSSPGTATGRGGRSGLPTLVSGANPSTFTCCYCQQGHPARDCKVVTQPEARKQILCKSGRCFVCTRTGHLGRECRSKSRCNKCSRRHHVSICPGVSSEGGGPTSQSPKTESDQGGSAVSAPPHQNRESASVLNANAAPFPPQNTTTALFVATKRAVLLQTAQATVHNPSQPLMCRDFVLFSTSVANAPT